MFSIPNVIKKTSTTKKNNKRYNKKKHKKKNALENKNKKPQAGAPLLPYSLVKDDTKHDLPYVCCYCLSCLNRPQMAIIDNVTSSHKVCLNPHIEPTSLKLFHPPISM